ncbi:hypothetical protein [Clostridioides difficile]|uniref:hypothetical protein n=1 Tax=Clostridioides difficile TaxID=1496 RepID=UPI0020C3B4DA|nr:hypothetical protein [Clostridioides difficile]MCP8399795.1 hypothetical protein [Clostridioides difficile]
MQQKCKKKALSMILSISMGFGSVASFNASNIFADTIEESTNAGSTEGNANAGSAEGETNAGNAEEDTNAGNAEEDTNAGNAEGDTNAGNAEGDTNAGNAEGDTNAGNAEEDTNAGNAEGDTNAGNAEGDANAGNAEEDMNALVVEEATAEDPTSVGDFKISGGEINVDFKFASGVLTILSGKQMTIQNNNPNTPTTHRIVIPKDVKAELIFDGVNIKTASNSPFTLTPDKDGGAYAHVILQDGSENKLESGDKPYPGIRAGKSTTLIIDDSIVNRDIEGEFIVPENGKIPRDVTLENGDKLKKGDRLTLLDSKNSGSLTAVGNSYAAGIGGGDTENGGNIIINGGIINATAKEGSNTVYGAGIGGGRIGDGGDITINGGTITAKGAYHGAGIGGGYYTGISINILNPSVVDPSSGYGYSGNITINGGLSYSYGGAHGSAFGDGCTKIGVSRGYRVLVTGGTVLPYITGTETWLSDLSAVAGDVIVTGGSLKATTFKSNGGVAVAYGDLEKKTEVFMNKISLTYLGQDKVNTTLVEDFKMLINGKIYPYGAPSYTDDQGVLYLWFSDQFKKSEVSVNLVVIDKITGENIKPNDFYIKDIGSGSQYLKQYEEFTIDNTPPYLINKRYDGLPFEEDVEKGFLDWLLKDGGIPITTPAGEKLTDKKFMTISSQRLNDETMEPDINLGSDEFTKQVDAGKYQLNITSTQFSNEYPFNEAYWGHRAFYKAEIIPADAETSLVVEESKVKTDVFKPTDTFTLNATVSPDKKEGPDCASPRGYVQFYINGKEYKNPVELKTHNKGSESHNYSTASIEWRPLDNNHHIFTTEQTITVKYIGDDINYIEGSEDEKKLKLDMTNVDVDGDGKPDINIDTDGDGRPDINIDTSGDWKPDINIDTDNTGEWKPSTEGGNGDGIWKPDKNIDTNGDGNPDTDYNRPAIDADNDGVDDYWKPDKNVDTGSGGYDTGNPDPNKPDSGNGGNSKPDSGNGGNSKPDSGNGGNSKPDSGNGGNSKPDIDTDGDGKPDIDIDGDGKPDINIDTDGDGKPDINIDTDGDGKPDVNIDIDGDGKPDVNIDIDGDGKPDINIDTDGDGKPDINIDTDGDGKPDINIDIDGDGKPDVNIDIDGDGKPDINIDTDESLDSNVGQNVQTGDQSNIMLDLALMFISLFFLIKNLTNKYLRRK